MSGTLAFGTKVFDFDTLTAFLTSTSPTGMPPQVYGILKDRSRILHRGPAGGISRGEFRKVALLSARSTRAAELQLISMTMSRSPSLSKSATAAPRPTCWMRNAGPLSAETSRKWPPPMFSI